VRITFNNPAQQGINPDEIINMKIFPNPTTGQFMLQSEHRIESIIITDINGKQVLKIDYPSTEIDVSNLENGIYFLQIETLEGLVTTKIVKQ
jgi:hypothetical protein